jgi:hypothetical protein
MLEECSNVTELFRRFALGRKGKGLSSLIVSMPTEQRLALEMALHEDDERQALEGELSVLEARWKEAEEIAAISDGMFVPAGITERMRELKDGRP